MGSFFKSSYYLGILVFFSQTPSYPKQVNTSATFIQGIFVHDSLLEHFIHLCSRECYFSLLAAAKSARAMLGRCPASSHPNRRQRHDHSADA